MIKTLLFSAALITFAACTNQSTGSTKEVEQLNTDWSKTTTVIQQYSNDMQATFARCNALRDTMALPPGSLQRLNAADRKEVATILKNMADYNNDYIDLGRALSPFFRQWLEQTERLHTLTIVVENGNQLENKDIPTEIADLQAAVKNADSNVKSWSDQLKALQSKMEADYAQFLQQTASL